MTEKRRSLKEVLKKVPEIASKMLRSLRRAVDEGGFTIDPEQRIEVERLRQDKNPGRRRY